MSQKMSHADTLWKKIGVFRDLNQIHNERTYISNDLYLETTSHLSRTLFRKKDFLWKKGVWRNAPQSGLIKNLVKYPGMNLVLGHADKRIGTGTIATLRALGVRMVFSTNLTHHSPYSFPLPIGLCDASDQTTIHELLGNRDHFLRANESAKFPELYNGKLLVNFSASNNVAIRGSLLKFLKREEIKINFQTTEFSDTGRINYLRACRESAYVLCPEGNGIDTHRLWETLYMGGIPIVTSNVAIDSLVEFLPVLVLENWNQLKDNDFLESEWNRIQAKEHDFSRIESSYWNKLLIEANQVVEVSE
jgi:hypothetical protein